MMTCLCYTVKAHHNLAKFFPIILDYFWIIYLANYHNYCEIITQNKIQNRTERDKKISELFLIRIFFFLAIFCFFRSCLHITMQSVFPHYYMTLALASQSAHSNWLSQHSYIREENHRLRSSVCSSSSPPLRTDEYFIDETSAVICTLYSLVVLLFAFGYVEIRRHTESLHLCSLFVLRFYITVCRL